MFRSALARRLLIPYLLLIGAATVAVGLFAADRMRTSSLDDRQEALRQEARLVAALIRDDAAPDRVGGLEPRLRLLAERAGCRITVIDAAGRVLADTQADASRMDDHRLRPEIMAASAWGEGVAVRHSDTLGKDMMYFALREAGPGGTPTFVRLAVPLAGLDEHARRLTGALAWATGLAVAVGAAVCLLLGRAYSRRLLALAGQAQAIARGDVRRRSGPDGPGELGDLAGALNAIGESLERWQAEAARKREELTAILNSMHEGVVAADAQQRIFLCNPATGALLDADPAAAVGRALWEIVRDDGALKAAAAVLADGVPRRLQMGSVRRRVIEASLAPLAFQGRREGLVLVVRDTTETARYQEMRKEFVANVSHELRTPLTFVQGFVETLSGGALRDPVKGPEYLATIEKHVRQLTNLVNDLLQLSRIESRPDLPRRERVDAADVARRAADLLGPAAARKRQTLSVEASAGPVVLGDPDYLERAVTNLVDNAIKYTPEGGAVTLAVSGDALGVRIEVRDNGIGIPAGDLSRIFERFYRVDKSRSREMGGTGLGLAIVKHIAQAHGGTVEVASEPGRGSTFRIVLPAAT